MKEKEKFIEKWSTWWNDKKELTEAFKKELNNLLEKPKEIDFFIGMDKQIVLDILKKFETMGTLDKFIKLVAPDYYIGASDMKIKAFTLANHLGLYEIKKQYIKKKKN